MKILKENINQPYEGFFWFINDEMLGLCYEVPKYNYELKQSKTHEEVWNKIKPNNCDKKWDYYPRGRVMVDPNYDSDNKFTNYSAMIFLDPCINNNECKNKIIDYYNLNVPNINLFWMGNLKQRSGIDHYSCHQCRGKNEDFKRR